MTKKKKYSVLSIWKRCFLGSASTLISRYVLGIHRTIPRAEYAYLRISFRFFMAFIRNILWGTLRSFKRSGYKRPFGALIFYENLAFIFFKYSTIFFDLIVSNLSSAFRTFRTWKIPPKGRVDNGLWQKQRLSPLAAFFGSLWPFRRIGILNRRISSLFRPYFLDIMIHFSRIGKKN